MACHLHNTAKSIQNVFAWTAKRISKFCFQYCLVFVSVWRRTNSWIRRVTQWSDHVGHWLFSQWHPTEKWMSVCCAVKDLPCFSYCFMFSIYHTLRYLVYLLICWINQHKIRQLLIFLPFWKSFKTSLKSSFTVLILCVAV